jgi:hypothetical protein
VVSSASSVLCGFSQPSGYCLRKRGAYLHLSLGYVVCPSSLSLDHIPTPS